MVFSLSRRARLGVVALVTALSCSTAVHATAQQPRLQDMSAAQSQQLEELFQRFSPVDQLGRPTPATAKSIRDFAHQPWIPPQVRDAILTALNFTIGAGETGGPDLPSDGPAFTQFLWPTVSGSCINGELDAVGTAIAVPGPTTIPAPGANAAETTFLFTALGTAPAAQKQNMTARWFNLSNGRSGTTRLGNHGINPDGPATISGTAATGRGTIVAVIDGTVHTDNASCSFLPTAAIVSS